MSLKTEAAQAAGELFIIGFQGLELESSTAQFISQAGIGGVILFAHNYEGPAQTVELTNQIQDCRRDLPLWVSVDHEGGKVQRFKRGFTKIPDAATIGATESPNLAFKIGEVIAKELKAVGINLNYAPVADIATNPKNPVIGNRAFGTKEDIVSKFCSAVVRGHLTQGVQPCLKHFPGHGDTHLDSHFALPTVNTSLQTLQERELKPFVKAVKSHCSFIMMSHILLPHIDPQYPATRSQTIIQTLLRDQMHYSRLIITDDMEMKAITDHFGEQDAPCLALQAGCDLLLYRTESATRVAYASVVKAIEQGQLNPTQILTSVERIRAAKKELLLPYHRTPITELSEKIATSQHAQIVEQILMPRIKR